MVASYGRERIREGKKSLVETEELGGAVQFVPMKPVLRTPGSTHLKLTYDGPLSNYAFNFDLRPYSWG